MSNTGIRLLTISAIILGPIVALGIQRWSDNRRESLQRKLWIFKTLMMNRATRLAPAYVQALNLIDVEFKSDSKADKRIRTAWKVLLDHLASDQTAPGAGDRATDLTANLLSAMGQRLDYDFDEVYIKKNAYYPVGLGNIEQELHLVRKNVLELLDGKRRLPIAVLEQKFPDLLPFEKTQHN